MRAKSGRFEEATLTKKEVRRQLNFEELGHFFFDTLEEWIKKDWAYNFTTGQIGYGGDGFEWAMKKDRWGMIQLLNVLENGDVILTVSEEDNAEYTGKAE